MPGSNSRPNVSEGHEVPLSYRVDRPVNVMFVHDFGILVYALLCRGDTKFKLPKAGNGNVFFPNKRVRFARADKAVALQYHNQ